MFSSTSRSIAAAVPERAVRLGAASRSYRPRWPARVRDPLLDEGYQRNEAGKIDSSMGIDPTESRTIPARANVGVARRIMDFVLYTVTDKARISVMYNPGVDVTTGASDEEYPWMPTRSDVALYHELVVAHQYTDRRQSPFRDETGAFEHEGAAAGLRWEEGAGTQLMGTTEHAFELQEVPPWNENRYRAARRAIGEHGVGAREGDTDMARRTALHPPGPPPRER